MKSFREIAKDLYFRLWWMRPTAAAYLFIPMARKYGCKLKVNKGYLDVISGNRVIRLSHQHQMYLVDIACEFDFYHAAVEPIDVNGTALVDYSLTRYHEVRGFDLHPVMFPSLAEPMSTMQQYLDFAQLQEGSIVLDLGAYSGLSSILFSYLGKASRVIAVEADRANLTCIRKNVALYERITRGKIDVLYGAVWDSVGEIEFSSEGSMGSAAASIVGSRSGPVVKVPTTTLSAIADDYGLERIDFIKCDIEGAEAVTFKQPEFFAKFKPRIIIEVHPVGGALTSVACREILEPFGYQCREVPQPGSHCPLLECVVA